MPSDPSEVSDAGLLYRAYAHEIRDKDAGPYWRELESRFPELSRTQIWQLCAPRNAMWTPQAEDRWGKLAGDPYNSLFARCGP